jgi:hypothetical protein
MRPATRALCVGIVLATTLICCSYASPDDRQGGAVSDKVKHDGGKVWVEGVPDGGFGIQWDLFVKARQARSP